MTDTLALDRRQIDLIGAIMARNMIWPETDEGIPAFFGKAPTCLPRRQMIRPLLSSRVTERVGP